MRDSGGVLRTITRVRMRDAGGTLRTIQQIRMRDIASVLKTVFQYFSATASTAYVYGSANFPGPATTASVTATPVGGTAPFTYLWERVDAGVKPIPDTPNAATTTFSATKPFAGGFTGNYHCKVTDALGNIAYTPNVLAEVDLY